MRIARLQRGAVAEIERQGDSVQYNLYDQQRSLGIVPWWLVDLVGIDTFTRVEEAGGARHLV